MRGSFIEIVKGFAIEISAIQNRHSPICKTFLRNEKSKIMLVFYFKLSTHNKNFNFFRRNFEEKLKCLLKLFSENYVKNYYWENLDMFLPIFVMEIVTKYSEFISSFNHIFSYLFFHPYFPPRQHFFNSNLIKNLLEFSQCFRNHRIFSIEKN